MPHLILRCTGCEASHVPNMTTLHCRECQSPLDVEYTGATPPGLPPIRGDWTGPRIPLPVHSPDSLVTLGEGNTPCVTLSRIGERLGLRRLYAKLEFMNPTASFKDRGTAIMMSVARENSVREIVEDSSGNAGASVAAYAARAGIRAHIFAPDNAPAAKLRQIKVYGAEAHSVEGPREAATEAAIAFYRENNLVYMSHNLSPYFIEGTKTFAYEAVQQLTDSPPDHVVVPVGNGSLLIGAWKGFQELQGKSLVSQAPRMHCVQARAVMPIAAAFEGENWTPQPDARTIAGGISVSSPPRRQQVLEVLRASEGVAIAVEDEDIARWHRLLAEEEGIYAEPTSAAAFAGLEKLAGRGRISGYDVVLVPVTGSGLKDAPPA